MLESIAAASLSAGSGLWGAIISGAPFVQSQVSIS
jgi:hypothetical protein